MTTEQLRKVITVTNWYLGYTGLTISYAREDKHLKKELHLILSPKETLEALSIVGSLDIAEGMINNYSYYTKVADEYKFCQWEALSIAIRHEAEKELANDINMLEIDSALNALK